jgi:hypothetical protein
MISEIVLVLGLVLVLERLLTATRIVPEAGCPACGTGWYGLLMGHKLSSTSTKNTELFVAWRAVSFVEDLTAVCFPRAFADDKFWAQDLNCGVNGFPLDHLQQHVHAGCAFCDEVVMDRG